MSKKERLTVMLDSVPEYKLDYIIAYVEALMTDEQPNAETLAALAEGDEMLRTGKGQHFKGKAADFFAMLDAEDDDDVDD